MIYMTTDDPRLNDKYLRIQIEIDAIKAFLSIETGSISNGGR